MKLLTATALIGLLLVATAVWSAGTYLTKPVPMQFPNTPLRALNVSFPSESGSTISGWLYKSDRPRALAILMHGIRSNRGQMIARAEYLQSMEISSLVFDFQAHGESHGKIITLGYLESFDARAAFEYIKTIEPELPLLVIGVSMGGAAVLLSEPALDVDVLVLESVYPDVKTAISNRLDSRIPGGRYLTPLLSYQIKPRTGISAMQLAPVRLAGQVTAATLMLSGREDLHTTKEDTQRLFDALPQPKKVRFIDHAGHVDLEEFDSDQYWEIVQPFILKHLIGDA